MCRLYHDLYDGMGTFLYSEGPLVRRFNSPKVFAFQRFDGSMGGGPRVVVSTAAFYARVRGSVPCLGGLKETKMFLPHPRVKLSIVGSLRDRELACSASDHQGSNFAFFEFQVLLAQFSLYVHKGGLKPDSFHFPEGSIVRRFDSLKARCRLYSLGLVYLTLFYDRYYTNKRSGSRYQDPRF